MLGGRPDTASWSLALLGTSEWTVCLLTPEAWARDLSTIAMRLKAITGWQIRVHSVFTPSSNCRN